MVLKNDLAAFKSIFRQIKNALLDMNDSDANLFDDLHGMNRSASSSKKMVKMVNIRMIDEQANSMKKLQIRKSLVSVQPRSGFCFEAAYQRTIDELMNKFGFGERNYCKALGGVSAEIFCFRYLCQDCGSSATGLGFVNSDLCCSSSPTEVGSDELKCAYLPTFKALTNPISRQEFFRLPNHNKARLINRIINFYRKESGLISCLIPVLDARCPVVRFVLRKPIKANFIRHVVGADTSGICRKFISVIKLWAYIAGIFSPDHAHPHGHWNSSVLIKQNPRKVQGWCVYYEPLHIDLLTEYFVITQGDFSTSFVYAKEAFESRVFDGQKDGRIASKFKFSLVNVQDPLELSHNVASNVSKRYVFLMRQSLITWLICAEDWRVFSNLKPFVCSVVQPKILDK
uniref:Transposase n=1 Tax=Ditylenchus dipsaci TaxID=166011 RepID=A0A915DC41_9BILA